MFPTVALAQGRFVAPARAWMTPRYQTPAPVRFHCARPSDDAEPSAAADRGSSPDIRPAAARAAHVPFATGRRRTRPAAVPSLRRAGRAGAGRPSFQASIAHNATHHGAVLLLDKGLVVLAIGPAARERDPGRLAIIADGLVHEHTVIVRVEPEQVEGQQLAQLRQNLAQQALLPDQQRPALGPSRRNVG